MILNVVLLPEPLGPRHPRISPRETLKDTSRTTWMPANRLTSAQISSTVARFVADQTRDSPEHQDAGDGDEDHQHHQQEQRR